MSKLATQVVGNTNRAAVPPKNQHRKRFPFVFLVDVSGSTGEGPDPDIRHINTAIGKLFENLRSPSPSSKLADEIDCVDVCLISYHNTPETVIGWSIASNLPISVPQLTPKGETRTADALDHALNEIADRLRDLKATKTPFGMPHIVHLTDGKPTDMQPGDARWSEIQGKLARIDGTLNKERYQAIVLHYIAPYGATSGGQDVLAQLSGAPAVYQMGTEVDSFETLVNLITATITKITQNFATGEAANKAKTDTVRAGEPLTIHA